METYFTIITNYYKLQQTQNYNSKTLLSLYIYNLIFVLKNPCNETIDEFHCYKYSYIYEFVLFIIYRYGFSIHL